VVFLFGIAFSSTIAIGIGWEGKLPIKIGMYHLLCMLKYNMESETFLLGMTKVKTSSNKKAKKQNKQQNLSTDKKQKQRI